MAPRTNQKFVKHIFDGGWATDYGPQAFVPIDQANKVRIPWLNDADNIIYELDGGPHKMPGATKNNSATLESGAAIVGVYDAWFSGTTGVPTQHRIINIGTKIKKDNADNTFTDLFTGMTSGAVPSYCMLEDLLIIANDSGTDVPKSWDGTTAQSLAGSPPTFAFACEHKNKVWASGAIAAPSRLYYSVSLTPADWTNSGSGSIDISPDDGDRITAIASHRNELWVFKGPYKGSIHRITGSAPTGDDAFARKTFAVGIGAVNHNSLVPYGNDLIFMWSDGTIRTLSAVEQFGDFKQVALSSPIHVWIRDHVTKSSLKRAYAVNWPEYGVLLFALPIDSATTNNVMLMCDYRFDPPRWAKWPAYDMVRSLASGVDASSGNTRVILAGCDDGFVRTIGSSSRSIDTTDSIPYSWTTPFLDYDVPDRMKTIEGASISFYPRNSGSVTFGWTRDAGAQQTVSVGQGGGGAVLGVFLLDTDILGGNRLAETFTRLGEEGGEFRSIQYSAIQNVANEDVEIHSFCAALIIGGQSYENQP